MALASVLLSFAAALFAFLGVFAVVLPYAGSVLSFGAPALALAGVVLGGMAISHARREGLAGSKLGLAGVIMNAMVFVPALLGALTCGLCNAVLSGGAVQGPGPQLRFQVGPGGGMGPGPGPGNAHDGGLPPGLAPPPMFAPPAAPAGRDGGVEAPAPALPPPPISPGPAGGR